LGLHPLLEPGVPRVGGYHPGQKSKLLGLIREIERLLVGEVISLSFFKQKRFGERGLYFLQPALGSE